MALVAAAALGAAGPSRSAPPRLRDGHPVSPPPPSKRGRQPKVKVPTSDHDEIRLMAAARKRKRQAARQAKGMDA